MEYAGGVPVARSKRASIARHLSRIIFYTLLALIPLVAVPYGTVEPWWEALFECVVFALGALWIIEGMLSRGWFLKAHRIFLPVLLLILYAFIQTLPLLPARESVAGLNFLGTISADPYGTRLSIFKLLALTLAGVLFLRYTSSEHRLRALIYTLIGVGIVCAFFGILRQTTQRSEGFFLPFLSPGSGYGQFINRNHFAYLMEMTLGLTLGLIVGRGVRREQVLIHLALALPVWAALVLSNSRGGLFSMLAVILFLALLFTFVKSRPENRGREEREGSILWRTGHAKVIRPLLILSIILAVFIGAIWMGGEQLTSRLETVSSEVNADTNAGNEGVSRAEIWRATWLMIKEHPLLGVGINGYWTAITQYHDASGEATPQQAHNDYLELLASGGLIGVTLAAWFFVLLIKRARQSFRSKNSLYRGAAVGACAGLFGVAVHSVVDFGLHVTVNSLVFVALAVIAIIGSSPQDETRRRLN